VPPRAPPGPDRSRRNVRPEIFGESGPPRVRPDRPFRPAQPHRAAEPGGAAPAQPAPVRARVGTETPHPTACLKRRRTRRAEDFQIDELMVGGYRCAPPRWTAREEKRDGRRFSSVSRVRPWGTRRVSTTACGARPSFPAQKKGSSGEKDPKVALPNSSGCSAETAPAAATTLAKVQPLSADADRFRPAAQPLHRRPATPAVPSSRQHDAAGTPATCRPGTRRTPLCSTVPADPARRSA